MTDNPNPNPGANPNANPNRRQIKLEMPNAPATYSNAALISHTQSEIILDFIQLLPNDPRARVQHRVVMSPMHAKLLLNALKDNIARYESRFGTIETPNRPQSLADQLFSGVNPPGEGDDNG